MRVLCNTKVAWTVTGHELDSWVTAVQRGETYAAYLRRKEVQHLSAFVPTAHDRRMLNDAGISWSENQATTTQGDNQCDAGRAGEGDEGR